MVVAVEKEEGVGLGERGETCSVPFGYVFSRFSCVWRPLVLTEMNLLNGKEVVVGWGTPPTEEGGKATTVWGTSSFPPLVFLFFRGLSRAGREMGEEGTTAEEKGDEKKQESGEEAAEVEEEEGSHACPDHRCMIFS